MLRMITRYKHLRPEERDQIAILKAQGDTEATIARKVGRDRSTVHRELRRNAAPQETNAPLRAQELAQARMRAGRKRPLLKNAWLRAHVAEKLRAGWSPERISGRLQREHPGHWERNISPESIYNFLYSEEANPALKELLVRRHRRRGKGNGRGRKKHKILGRVGIEERPAEIEDRRQAGHWEGDSVIGRVGEAALHTEVERTTRVLRARLLPDKSASTTLQAQLDIFRSVPSQLRRSVTLDNGLENAAHQGLHELGMQTYFARPYHSWERGSNENANGLIRRWLPKGTSFNDVTQADIDAVVCRINDLPRKCHNFASANEEWARLSEKAGVALHT